MGVVKGNIRGVDFFGGSGPHNNSFLDGFNEEVNQSPVAEFQKKREKILSLLPRRRISVEERCDVHLVGTLGQTFSLFYNSGRSVRQTCLDRLFESEASFM
jgi:hypothetical protein